MMNIFNCKVSKKKEEISEKIKEDVKEYRCIFFRDFFIGLFIVSGVTFFMGYFDWLSQWIKVTDKEFEVLVTIIGFLGILLGFLLTALGIIVSGVQTRFQNEKDPKKQKDLNNYWKYLIMVSKSVIILLLFYILAFIVLITFIETITFYDGQIYLLAWSVLSVIMVCYITFDRIFDYYENPFK